MKKHDICFTKMHGLGNDFLIIDTCSQSINGQALPVRQLANRHTGIGFDQLLLIEPPTNQANFNCRIYNSDGSEAEQCGNGLRCVARYVHEEKIHTDHSLQIETRTGVYSLEIKDYQHIRVNMGIPQFNGLQELALQNNDKLAFNLLSLGNPHVITRVASLQSCPDIVPHDSVNIGFMEIVSPHHIRLRTIERGTGETFACGSNACAAAITGISNNELKQPVQVEFKYGSLWIEWAGKNEPVYLTGPAERVYSGEIRL